MEDEKKAPPTLGEVDHHLSLEARLSLAAGRRGPDTTARLFHAWHQDVTRPLGIDHQLARELFTGRATAEEFASRLTDEQLDGFVKRFEELQAAHQARIDAGEVL